MSTEKFSVKHKNFHHLPYRIEIQIKSPINSKIKRKIQFEIDIQRYKLQWNQLISEKVYQHIKSVCRIRFDALHLPLQLTKFSIFSKTKTGMVEEEEEEMLKSPFDAKAIQTEGVRMGW